MCTFVGTTLDILIGLYFLISKHKNTYAVLNKNFIKNDKLCKFYKSIGVKESRCEFLNFEMIWVYQKLYFMDKFDELFHNNKKRFCIIPLGIETQDGSHANYLIYDKEINEVERFEPNGSDHPSGMDYKPLLLDEILEKFFKDFDPKIKYISPKMFLPKIGFQLLDSTEKNKKKIGDPGGFCAMWSIWYVDMRITHHNIPRQKLVQKMIKELKERNISFKNMIRNYSNKIIITRDKLLDKAKININNWINEDYNDEQLDIIIQEITKMFFE